MDIKNYTTLDSHNIAGCLVYVEAFKSSSGNNYSVIYADFMSNRAFEIFSTALGLQFDREKSMLEIRNYRSSKRLRPASYYRLNLGLLKANADYSPKQDEKSALIAYIIDMQNNELEKGQLLTRRTYKEPTRNDFVYNFSHYPSRLPDYQVNILRVNDTGQGNWNELLENTDVKLVYDIGTNIHATQSEMMKLWHSRENEYASTRPSLFLSHWDMDHFNILRVLSENDITNHFSDVYCVCKTPSLTSQRVY